jgi:hypothetical protein
MSRMAAVTAAPIARSLIASSACNALKHSRQETIRQPACQDFPGGITVSL